MEAPVIVKPIPNQIVNERASYGPFNLKEYIKSPEGSEPPRFSAGLKDGKSLPQGMICTEDGILTGIPAANTQGNYQIVVTAQNAAGKVDAEFIMVIKPSFAGEDTEYFDKLKSQVWEALQQHLPLPALGDILDRPVTGLDISYLLDRWGVLTIWDAFNLEPPGEKTLLNLAGVSQHYNVYDRGSCLIACPKDLFNHERTIQDSLVTARAMAQEVYKRGWTIEIAGIAKMSHAAWVEIQHLGDKNGKRLEIINYTPSPEELRLYNEQAAIANIKMNIE
jgi:hypothetical protein